VTIADVSQRAAALDPTVSFCVSAPAGSGKTELLIQRYLCLLSRVVRPEQVLAITFTRKAAAEMRARVVDALRTAQLDEPVDGAHQQTTRELALQALQADALGEWRLLRDSSGLNIKTIDSFCGGLTRQMPVLSEFGGQAKLLDDASELYAQAVLELFKLVDSAHPVASDLAALMLHFDNNWERLQSLLTAMLARRDQWRNYVGVHHAPEESEAYLLTSIETLIRGELAALAPKLAPHSAALEELMRYAAGNLGREAPACFPGTEPVDVADWRFLSGLLLTKTGGWRRRIDVSMGFPAGQGEASDHKEQLKGIIAEMAQIDGLDSALDAVNYLPQIEPYSDSWQLLVHLSRLLPVLAAQLLLVFQRHGAVDHNQVALSALQALGDDDAPTELALRLDYQLEHILVDEFQDTAINQYELLRCLTRGWGQHNASNPLAPRTVMIVGDGMQSIYGFRGANVGLFLKARQQGFNGVTLEHLTLLSNFRSDAGVVEWVNDTFSRAFPQVDDINRGQVSYTPAVPVRSLSRQPAVSMHAFHGEQAQRQEAEFICRQIEQAVADDHCGAIAVLGRSRAHLQPVIAGLKRRAIAYSAQDLDRLADSPVVADLLNLCAALANGADRLAWLALLRAPWCALKLSDLLCIGQWGDPPELTPLWPALCDDTLCRTLSPPGRCAVSHLRTVLQQAQKSRDRLALRVWIEQTWTALGGPACAANEQALEDAESFLQLLEQADRDGIGLDTQWLSRSLEKRFRSAGDPYSKVQLMTLHKAKGLEFDRVIIPQLAKPPRSDNRELLLWDEHSGVDGTRNFLLAADDHSEKGVPTLYNYLRRQRQEKSLLEGTRLLYVGVTRAISQLQLTACLVHDERTDEFRTPSGASLLRPMWSVFQEQMMVHDPLLPVAAALVSAPMDGLVRLRRSAPASDSPAADSAASVEGPNIPVRPENHLQRSVGTVVHLALEILSCARALPESISDRDRARWRQSLREEGLWGAALEEALVSVEDSVRCTLQAGGEGRWVLSAQHLEARSEWPLTWLDREGRVHDLVIDRTFVDVATDIRWIVDYKNSQPESGEAVARFVAREATTYRPQLLRYRDAVRELDSSRALRCALYFTALGRLHTLDDLDLPAAEEI